MKRFGQMIKLKKGCAEEYIRYHQNSWTEVNQMINKSNIRNYSIYFKDDFLFSYFEYVGNDFERDMQKIAADETTQKWWSLVKPLMEPVENREEWEFWANMAEVYHLD